jgi:hypothetical protein
MLSQVATLGSDDFKRTEYYRANAKRAEIQTSAGGLGDFFNHQT